ncbi:MAG: iron ABC transporter permease [Candidatus Wallbacteria bacterium]|nr:iron ABC transporter permease [Candidatus Wallbacteria bacterium]
MRVDGVTELSKLGRVSVAALLAFVAAGLLAYFGLLPLALLVRHSFQGAEPFASYALVASRSANWTALRGTLTIATGAAAIAFLLGVPLGWLVAATDLPMARVWRSLLALPYVIPAYIGAVGWTYLLSGKAGWLDRLWTEGLGLPALPFSIYSLGGIVFVEGAFFSPFVLMAVAEAVERIDPALEEAARVSGAGPVRVWLEVTWPLVRRAALGGVLMAFLGTCASYGVPAVLGPSARPSVSVLTTRIKGYIDLHTTGGFRQATALSAVLLLAALVFPLAERAGGGDARAAGARPSARRPASLGRWRAPALAMVAGVFGVTTLAPIMALGISSLMGNVGRGFRLENLSLVHYWVVLGRPDALLALKNSVLAAAAAATLAVVIGTALALVAARGGGRFGAVLAALPWLPYAAPGTVLAIGIILAFTGAWGLNLYGTLWMLLVAYTAKYLALACRMAAAGIEQVHPSMEEAARVSGASRLRAVGEVLVPMIRGHLAAAWFLVFMPSFGELTMSVLLFGPDTPTLGTTLFELQSYEDPSAASVLAVLIVAVILLSNFLVRRLSGGRYGI